MKTLDYFQMRTFFIAREANKSVEFKLNELENLWYCTQKSVKRRLKQYAEDERFLYLPGKGRGNHSVIQFQKSFQDELDEEIEKLIVYEQFEDIFHILQLPIPKSITSSTFRKVQNLFGMKTTKQEKDTLRTFVTRGITTLDPLHVSINLESFLIHQLGDTLVIYDEKTDCIHPHLAHSWEKSTDNRIWTFYLRKNVRFHSQQILTSEDVKYSIERFQTNASSYHWLVEEITKIECPSSYIVRFELAQSNPFFLRYLSVHNLVILPKGEPFNEYNWTGTGPFQVKKRTDTQLVLEAFDDYFLARPLIDEVQIYRIPLETKNIITYDIVQNKEGENPQDKLSFEVGFRYLAFNFRKQNIIQNPLFRKALYHLFDVKKMWNDLGRSDLRESSSYFYWQSKSMEKNPKIILNLLEESGYRGEVLTLFTVNNPGFINMAEWLKKEGAQIGINFTIQLFTLEELYEPIIEEADLLFMGEVASTDYHLSFFGAFLNKALIFNRFFTPDHLQIISDYFDQMKQEVDRDKRESVIEKVEEFIRKENLFLYLYHPVKKRIFHSMIKDVEFDSYGYVDFRKVWFK
ncbi:ABC transporter substrate-binding protein [Fredinandcohnia humi]